MVDVLSRSTAKKSREGVDMPLLDPGTVDVLSHQGPKDKAPVEMYLKLLGPDSEKTRRALNRIQYRMSKVKEGVDKSDDELHAESAAESKILADLTVGGLVFMREKWVDIDRESAFDLYMTVPQFRGQALTFILNPKNYFRG